MLEQTRRLLLKSNSQGAGGSKGKTIVRGLISLVLLAVVYSSVNPAELWHRLGSLSWRGVTLVLTLYTVGQLLSSFKWRIFVLQAGLSPTVGETIRAYFFGMFVNNFGLGTVGGDFARSLMLPAKQAQKPACFATVVADRIHGLGCLLCIGACSIMLFHPPVLGRFGVGFAVTAVISIVVFWLVGPRILTRIFPVGSRWGEAAQMSEQAFPRRPGVFAAASLISLFFHCSQIMMHFVIAQDLHADLSLAYLFATVPLVNIAASLPVSINGLGLRESMYVMLFVPAGVPQETAVAFGAIWILVTTTVSALGGLLLTPDISDGEPETAFNSSSPAGINEEEMGNIEKKKAAA